MARSRSHPGQAPGGQANQALTELTGATEWATIPALQELAEFYQAETRVERYHLYNRINRHLILQSPGAYFQGVGIACFNFWRVGWLMYPECVRSEKALPVILRLWLPYKALWLGVHLAFFLALLYNLPRWRTIFNDTLLMAILTQILVGGMFFQALLTYSNSTRYALPSEALIVIALAYFVCLTKNARHTPPRAWQPPPAACH